MNRHGYCLYLQKVAILQPKNNRAFLIAVGKLRAETDSGGIQIARKAYYGEQNSAFAQTGAIQPQKAFYLNIIASQWHFGYLEDEMAYNSQILISNEQVDNYLILTAMNLAIIRNPGIGRLLPKEHVKTLQYPVWSVDILQLLHTEDPNQWVVAYANFANV